jgi:surface polysaccharide O-acyltransferase-like enzyme
VTSTPATPAARNAYIDTLRGWSIVGVVCVHFAGSFVTTDIHAWSPSFFLGLALNQFFGFAVPLFVFLSGLLAGSSRKEVPLGEYYRGRFWRIAFPYLLASVASFFLLNHHAAWSQLPDDAARFRWLWQRTLFYGVEPTLYFIPLILQLYLLQPALKALPGWLQRLVPALSQARAVTLVTALLLALHLTLGLLCNRGTLDYYVWGRPNVFFWMFYFFAGLHFRTLTSALAPATIRTAGWVAGAVAVSAMAWNFSRLVDPAVVGLSFERNRLDFAYARPEMLAYDLAMVAALAAGLLRGWNPRPGAASYLGRFTLEIYLWHILVLYYGAWRYADAIDSCRRMPELIVIICVAAAVLIALAADGLQRAGARLRHHLAGRTG